MSFKKAALTFTFAAAVFALGLTTGMQMQTADAAPATDQRVFELRTYTTNEGKLDDLHARFSTHTNYLFVKHGISLVGYWTPADLDNTLIYLIAHEDMDAAKANWRGFGSDPAWRAAYADSRADGPIVNNITSVYMDPTDYSPLR